MTIPGLPPRSLALVMLRALRHWPQQKLAEAVGLHADTISEYERGKREPPAGTFQQMAAAMEHRPELVARVLAFAAEICGAVKEDVADTLAGERHQLRELAAGAGRETEGFLLVLLARVQNEEARRLAREARAVLADLAPPHRRRFLAALPDLHTWAVVEALCAESERLAAHRATEARQMAELALWVADRVAVSARPQAQGYAWGFLGNARRVANDLPGADDAFATAWRLWGEGGGRDAVPLDGSRLLDLEASLRKDERRLGESLELLERAARTPGLSPLARARLLVKKANTLRLMADFAGALAALQEATPAIEGSQEPRLLWTLRFASAVNLCHLERAAESAKLLPQVRALAAQIGNDLDRLRLRWLEAKVAAGLGRPREAVEALSRVWADFAALEMGYDAALAMVELAILYLKEGRTPEVRRLTRLAAPIFAAKGVHPEAQNALALFREAVERETATVVLAQRLLHYLERARCEPRLRFEA